MEVGWSRFRGFEDRSEVIIQSIEAMEFINLVEKIQNQTATEFHKEIIKKRVEAFNTFFLTFMNLFPDRYKNRYEEALKLASENKYSKIKKDTLKDMQKTLQKFSSSLSAAQSRDMELLRLR